MILNEKIQKDSDDFLKLQIDFECQIQFGKLVKFE